MVLREATPAQVSDGVVRSTEGAETKRVSKVVWVVKRVRNNLPDEGAPVVAALSPRFPCLGAGYMGASCSPR